MKKLLSVCLILAATAAAAAPLFATAAPKTTGATAARSDINCGFVCDSFGRCRRVCW
jgi:hypothetical protein